MLPAAPFAGFVGPPGAPAEPATGTPEALGPGVDGAPGEAGSVRVPSALWVSEHAANAVDASTVANAVDASTVANRAACCHGRDRSGEPEHGRKPDRFREFGHGSPWLDVDAGVKWARLLM